MSLERLEAEVVSGMVCRGCQQAGEARQATHVAVYRAVCVAGGRMPPQPEPDFLVCREHADALLHFRIGRVESRWCAGCRQNVSREMWSHVLALVEPIDPSP